MSQSTETRVECPFCEADDCELISLYGSQLLLSQYRCKRCGSYFEAVRREDEHGS
jgi:transposase-like protein